MEQIILSLESQLYAVRGDVDRLAMKEQINSIARRVADLEAMNQPG